MQPVIPSISVILKEFKQRGWVIKLHFRKSFGQLWRMNRKEARVVRKLLALSRQEVYKSLMPNQVNGVLLDSSCIKYLKKKKEKKEKSTNPQQPWKARKKHHQQTNTLKNPRKHEEKLIWLLTKPNRTKNTAPFYNCRLYINTTSALGQEGEGEWHEKCTCPLIHQFHVWESLLSTYLLTSRKTYM